MTGGGYPFFLPMVCLTEDEAKAVRKVMRAGLDVIRRAWSLEDTARKAHNRQMKVVNKEAMEVYEAEKSRCRTMKCLLSMPKLILSVEKLVPRSWIPYKAPSKDSGIVLEGTGDMDEKGEEMQGDKASGDDGDQLSD